MISSEIFLMNDTFRSAISSLPRKDKRMAILSQKEISFLVDNNIVFWKMLNDLIEETIKLRYC